MFQDYMRSRLGLGATQQMPTSTPAPEPSNPAAPPGYNVGAWHPQMNPYGWNGHPMNTNGGNTGVVPPWMNGNRGPGGPNPNTPSNGGYIPTQTLPTQPVGTPIQRIMPAHNPYGFV